MQGIFTFTFLARSAGKEVVTFVFADTAFMESKQYHLELEVA